MAERTPHRDPGPVTAAIVLAAGHGSRFGRPKYAVELVGRRLVDHALDLVEPIVRDLLVVLPPGHEWEGRALAGVVDGGSTRTESLRRALPLVPDDVEIVVTHDCVRPLASADQVRAAIDAVGRGADAAIPCWEPPDVLKHRGPDGSLQHLGREGFVVCQSPSAYRATALRRMFARLDEVPIDETVGIELIGGRVVGVAGDRWSQHVVDERDVELFERLLRGTGH